MKPLERLFTLNVVHEHFGGLECRNFVLWDDDCGVLGDVAGCLLGTSLDDEATESAKVNMFAVNEAVLHNFHELLDGSEDTCFVNSGCFGDFADDFCFCHVCLKYE